MLNNLKPIKWTNQTASLQLRKFSAQPETNLSQRELLQELWTLVRLPKYEVRRCRYNFDFSPAVLGCNQGLVGAEVFGKCVQRLQTNKWLSISCYCLCYIGYKRSWIFNYLLRCTQIGQTSTYYIPLQPWCRCERSEADEKFTSYMSMVYIDNVVFFIIPALTEFAYLSK